MSVLRGPAPEGGAPRGDQEVEVADGRARRHPLIGTLLRRQTTLAVTALLILTVAPPSAGTSDEEAQAERLASAPAIPAAHVKVPQRGAVQRAVRVARNRQPTPPPKPTPDPPVVAQVPLPPPTEVPATLPPPKPVGWPWDALAQCESGGNWQANTGNGYYGGLQFLPSTWRSVGGTGLPHEASREEQVARGQALQARSGWGQWPACARKLGLR